MQDDDYSEEDSAIHLSFDTAAYPVEHGPCQILAHSFYSPGMSYCIEAASGFHLPIPKAAIKDAMENGRYVWVSKIDPVALRIGSAFNFVVRVALTSAGYDPLICTKRELEARMSAKPFYASFRRNGTKVYRHRKGYGSNVPKQRKAKLQQEELGGMSSEHMSAHVWDQAAARARGEA